MIINLPHKNDLVRFASALKKDRFTPGSDRVTVEENLDDILINGDYIIDCLTDGSYIPKPAMTFFVAKRDGSERLECYTLSTVANAQKI